MSCYELQHAGVNGAHVFFALWHAYLSRAMVLLHLIDVCNQCMLFTSLTSVLQCSVCRQ